ncbi:MAG TPA: Uma2 family endonuclease [Bacilli bacterium]
MSEPLNKKKKETVKEKSGTYDIPERYEMIGGIRYDFLPSPKYVHQIIIGNLYLAMYTSCHPKGRVILAPMDVHFDEGDNVAQPDIIFIANENLHIIRDGYVFGAPDLLIEILSPSTGKKDKTVKKAMFEQFGVKEYWLVDPTYFTVDQFLLIDNKYVLIATHGLEEAVVTSPQFACMAVPLKDIFASVERPED